MLNNYKINYRFTKSGLKGAWSSYFISFSKLNPEKYACCFISDILILIFGFFSSNLIIKSFASLLTATLANLFKSGSLNMIFL